MNTEQAKLISLPNLLSKLGHEPVKVTKAGRELWYQSPFREEKDPSFHTSYLGGKWIWNDFGDKGGTVIDFVMRYQNYTRVKDALDFLSSLFQPDLFHPPKNQPFSFQQQDHREAVEIFSEDRSLEFLDAQPIKSRAILNYLEQERHIPAGYARRYLHEVTYRNLNNGKEYFAFGMPNQSGGYEIRVASSKYQFKSALKARDITIVQGEETHSKTVCIFEGMTDFLSFLVMQKRYQLPFDAIIMHSLSSYPRTADAIRQRGYEQIYTYLDNNRPGQETTETFTADFGAKTIPQNHLFAPHVDLNDALRAQSSKRPPTKYRG